MKKTTLIIVMVVATITSSLSQVKLSRIKTGQNATGAQKSPAAVKPSSGTTTNCSSGKRGLLTNTDVVQGLKDALTLGTTNSSALASKLDGFYKNPSIFIPFPPEAQMVKDKVDALGFQEQTDKFVMTLNRAAEEAATNAAPVFVNAIKGMSISDGFSILNGSNNAATEFLKSRTTAELKNNFTPIVQAALDKVDITKYWSPIISTYNRIPFVEPQNPNLTGYVTDRALSGLFKLIADEEIKIRSNPAAQVTDVLQNVFGSLLHQ